MRQILVVILAAVLVTPSSHAQGRPVRAVAGSDPKQEVLAIAAGAPVELRLTDKTKVRGQLGAISDADFEVRMFKGGVLETQRIRFEHLKSIRDTSRPSFGRSLGRGFAVAGIVVGVVIAVCVIATAAANN